jgi:hypothetical protein
MSDEREVETLHQVLVVPVERPFVNLRNATHRTESLDDSIRSVEFWTGFGNESDAIPMGNSSSEK